MTTTKTNIDTTMDDEPAANTPFYRALRWRVHDPEEALSIAGTHRCCAAEARGGIPDVTDYLRAWSAAAGREQRASRHDEIAAVCERHAARLLATRDATRNTVTGPRKPNANDAAARMHGREQWNQEME